MQLRPHPRTAELTRALGRALPLASRWAGDAFRMAESPFSNARDLLSGEGASKFGQRWNPPGIATVYACLDDGLAMFEWQAQRKKAGMVLRRHLPLTQVTVIAALHKIMDFRKRRVQSALGVPMLPFITEKHRPQDDGDPELLAQAFGRVAVDLGLEGIIVPAAPDPARFNLVVFRQNLRAKSSLRIHGVRFLHKSRLK